MLSSILGIVLVINELMASNAGVVMSPAYNFDSWIELYNPTEQAVDLAGFYLSNDVDNLKLWQMPDDIGSVPAKGFRVVWFGSDDILSSQAPFKLDCDGGIICLSDKSGNLVTQENYPEALSRTAYARKTDGGGEWGWTANPTPGATNSTSRFAEKRLDAPVVSVGSQLLSGPLTFKVDIPKGTTLMYTTDGSIPASTQAAGGDSQQPTWKNWIKNGDCEGSDESCLVGRSGDNNGDTNIYFLDGVGYNGSRGIKVHSIDNPANHWDTQFFVYTPDHVWASGDKYRFSMKVRADKPDHITPEAQRTPGNYIHWQMLDGGYNVGTEWRTIDYEGFITDEQAGDGAMQTIAFHLNESAEANNFYFDDIVWESYNAADVAESGQGRQSKDGLFTVTRTTNYVFRLFRDGYLPSVPVTRSFIQTNNDYTIPVISIVGDERYFTDPMWGIDVVGSNGKTGNGREDPVNWNQPWDRPVNFSYISPTDGMLFNQDVNISVSGGWSRMSSPRSMKLKSAKVFDGLNHLDYVFFPQKPYIRNKALLVRNGGNDSQSRFIDPALATVIQRSGIDLDVQSFVQVAEYINGRFKGVLNLREPNNDKFVYANYGYDDEDIDMFENTHFRNGTKDVFDRLLKLSEHINDAGVFDEVKQLLDMDEFTNYMATELFLGNDDWPNNNVKGYRSQKDGRYRFICFDLDYAFNEWSHTISSLDNYSSFEIVRLFKNLLQHDGFRKKFIDTFCIIGGSVFEKDRVTAIVNELADAMRPMLQFEGKQPDNSANMIKSKMATRFDVAISQLQQYKPMQLSGAKKQSVRLDADTEGATIFVNGIEVPYAQFNGKLFAPIQIEAKAPAGYRFMGWRQSSGSLVQVISSTDTWKFYDAGEAADGWQSASYSDAAWSSGAAPLGYKMNGVKTTVSYGADADRKHPTTYFRKTFTLSTAPKTTDVFELNYQLDDGCVVWVNGQEAGRVNMHSGTVSYSTFSSTYAGDTPMTGTLDLSPSLFVKGRNVIAVEVHNTSYTSGDLFWSGELLTSVGATSGDTVIDDPVIDLPTASSGFAAGTTLSLTACFTPLTDAERRAQGLTPVRINEVSAANSIYVNEYFKHNDWVELYNTTDKDMDVEGMYLSDNPEEPYKYRMTRLQASTIIPAHGYLIIWCDKLDPLSQLHAPFKLAAEGDELLLTAADRSWTDRFVYTAMNGDETVGRYPDGSNHVVTMNVPTIARANITGSYATVVSQPESVGIHDIMARQVSRQTYNMKGQAVQGTLSPGIYIRDGRKIIVKRKH